MSKPSQPLIIVPVFNAFDFVCRCLSSLAAHNPQNEILVIDDASTDERISPLLREWAASSEHHHLKVQSENRGFVHTANNGLLSSAGDVVLLNSDTEVTPGWLDALTRCLDTTEHIATATPWTNNGEIVSIPDFCRPNPPPANPNAIGRVLRERAHTAYPEIPTAVGFCMAISRAAIDTLGLFDEDRFGHGYGEENDYSMRARHAGLRNVLCDDAYVVHHGAASFGPLGLAPGEDSMNRLLARHPQYMQLIAAFIEDDPLAPHREAVIDALNGAGVRLR